MYKRAHVLLGDSSRVGFFSCIEIESSSERVQFPLFLKHVVHLLGESIVLSGPVTE